MVQKLGTGVLVVLLAASVSQVALARHSHGRVSRKPLAAHCAKAEEVTSMQVAAVQQELMVAALTCNAISDFNAFQTAFQGDLRLSDKHLLEMFKRVFGREGEAKYHSYKTRLANDDSVRSIHDVQGYCAEAHGVFTAAQAPDHPQLAAFVSTVATHDSGPVDSCEMQTASGGLEAVPAVLPTPNPDRLAELDAVQAPPGTQSETGTAPAAPKH